MRGLEGHRDPGGGAWRAWRVTGTQEGGACGAWRVTGTQEMVHAGPGGSQGPRRQHVGSLEGHRDPGRRGVEGLEGHRDPERQPHWARGTQEVSEGRHIRTEVPGATESGPAPQTGGPTGSGVLGQAQFAPPGCLAL